MNFPYGSFVFIDSMKFCPAGNASLEKQINTITENGKYPERLDTLRKAIEKLYPNAEPDAWKLLAGKMPFGAYSQYNDKVANLPFPPREKCINSLTREIQSVEDRARIDKIMKEFHLKTFGEYYLLYSYVRCLAFNRFLD